MGYLAGVSRGGRVINPQRVLRMMRSDNLLAVRLRKWVRTTDSRHDGLVYVNLAARMTRTGVNQLWVAEITSPISVYGWNSFSWRWSSLASRARPSVGRWIVHWQRSTPTRVSRTPVPTTSRPAEPVSASPATRS